MKKPQLNSYLFLSVITLSFSGSWRVLSSVFGITPAAPEDFVSCMESNSINATSISRLIFSPANTSFLPVWQVGINNLRFDQPSTTKPSVIVTPVDASLIRTAIFCTKQHGYVVRIRSGGHDFEGLSYTADVPFVLIDLTNMRSIDVHVATKSAWVQGGATLGELYYSISQKTDTLYFPAGACPGVGVGGFLGGGGYGNLMRKYGTGADNVVDVQFMDVNGNILNRKSMGEDLFWAIRGGGASSFGVVLAWKLRLVPMTKKVTVFMVSKTLEQGATEIFYKYQYIAPMIDRNLHIRVQMFSQNSVNSTNKTIRMSFEGTYLGTIDTLLPLLSQNFPELDVTREVCEEMRMIQSSLLFGGFTTSTSPEIFMNRSAIYKLNFKGKSDYVRTPIPIEGLKKIWKKILENDGSETMFFYYFGGKMEEYSETAIPYPHRAGVLYQIFKLVDFSDQPSDKTQISLKRIDWLRSFEKLLEPYVSHNPREAYFNYNDLDLGVGNATYEEASVWGERYWKRDNFKKLIRIKAKVDPQNFFRHPQSIPTINEHVKLFG